MIEFRRVVVERKDGVTSCGPCLACLASGFPFLAIGSWDSDMPATNSVARLVWMNGATFYMLCAD